MNKKELRSILLDEFKLSHSATEATPRNIDQASDENTTMKIRPDAGIRMFILDIGLSVEECRGR